MRTSGGTDVQGTDFPVMHSPYALGKRTIKSQRTQIWKHNEEMVREQEAMDS